MYINIYKYIYISPTVKQQIHQDIIRQFWLMDEFVKVNTEYLLNMSPFNGLGLKSPN